MSHILDQEERPLARYASSQHHTAGQIHQTRCADNAGRAPLRRRQVHHQTHRPRSATSCASTSRHQHKGDPTRLATKIWQLEVAAWPQQCRRRRRCRCIPTQDPTPSEADVQPKHLQPSCHGGIAALEAASNWGGCRRQLMLSLC